MGLTRFRSDPVADMIAGTVIFNDAQDRGADPALAVCAWVENFTEDQLRDMVAGSVGLLNGFVTSLADSKPCTYAEMAQEIVCDMRALLDT